METEMADDSNDRDLTDEEIVGPVDLDEGETLPDEDEVDPNELYAVPEDERSDTDPAEDDENFSEHVAGVDQEFDVGDEDDSVEFFGDDEDFDEGALLPEEDDA
jgi:hypothetical protein